MATDSQNQFVILKDKRRLGFAEYGDTTGIAVFHFNGSGSSRLEYPSDPTILPELGIRLISTDRPGHGISDPQPDRKLLDWPDDIVQLADHLNIDKFHVLGWSAGGPHALACAYKFPDRVITGALVSGLAPPDRPNPYQGLPLMLKIVNLLGRRIPSLVSLMRRVNYNMLQGDPEKVRSKLKSIFPPEDRKAIEESGGEEAMLEDVKEGFRQGWDGPAQDDIIINKAWGFGLDDIHTRFDVWQGEVDKNVPLNQGIYQHELLAGSRLHVLPGQAHLYLLTHWREILEALLT